MAALKLDQAWECRCQSAAALQGLGERLGAAAKPPWVLGLVGPMGAGKTTLVQGLARGLQVDAATAVVSPTYALCHEYPGARAPLVHIDLYRLQVAEHAVKLGLEEQIWRSDAVVAVEWADRFANLLPPHAAWLHLSLDADEVRLCRGRGLAAPP